MSITVLGYEGKSVYPLRISDNTDREHNIILMLIEEGVKHYCLVKSLSRLLSSQISNHDGKHHFCLNCLNAFPYEKSLNKHREYCGNYEAVKIQMPEKGKILKFKNHHRREKVPFIVYADFECYNRCNRANQTLKVVILNNIKNTNLIAVAIISSVSIIRYINRE